MHIRSGKVQFLFWTAFFSVMLYLWIIAVGLQNFVLVEEKPLNPPQNITFLLFVLYGILMVLTLAGELSPTKVLSSTFNEKKKV